VAIPNNAASEIFSRYSPARQTFANQIAALINGSQSLEEWFKQLYSAYNAGFDNPSNVCAACGWSHVIEEGYLSWITIQYATIFGDEISGTYPISLFGQSWVALDISWDFPALVNLSEVKIEFMQAYYSNPVNLVVANDFVAVRDSDDNNIASLSPLFQSAVDGTVRTLDASAEASASGQIQIIVRNPSIAPIPEFRVRVTMYGTGYDPFA